MALGADYVLGCIVRRIEEAAEQEYPSEAWERGPREAFIENAMDRLVERLTKMALEEE